MVPDLSSHLAYLVYSYILAYHQSDPSQPQLLPLELSIFYISDSLLCLSSSPLKQNKIVRFASTYLIRISHILMGKQIAVKIPVSQQTSLVDDERKPRALLAAEVKAAITTCHLSANVPFTNLTC